MTFRKTLTAAAALLVLGVTARAQQIMNPGDLIPGGGATYVNGTTLIEQLSDMTTISSLTDGALNIAYSPSVQSRLVGTSWDPWGHPAFTETSAPYVLYSGYDVNSIMLNFDKMLDIFGVEVAPRYWNMFHFTMEFVSSGIPIQQVSINNVYGIDGARLLAAKTAVPFDQVIISADDQNKNTDDGFSMAKSRYRLAAPTNVPEPGVLAMFVGAGLGLIPLIRRRK